MEATPIPFGLFKARLLSLYVMPLRTPSTRQRMVQVLGEVESLGVTSTGDLTTALVAAYVAARSGKVRTNTVIGELGYVRAACSFAFEEGWLRRNPFDSRRLRLRPEPRLSKSHHSLAEVARLLTHLERQSSTWKGGRLYALAATVAYTGLRRMETLRLMAADVWLTQGILAIVARHRLKTVASEAPVPIPAELDLVLRGWLGRVGSEWLFPGLRSGRPWVGGYPGTKALDQLQEAGRACGVEGLTFHSLRHSWATHAESAWGIPEPGIQRILRHTTPFTSRLYRHADLVNLRRLVDGVSYKTSA